MYIGQIIYIPWELKVLDTLLHVSRMFYINRYIYVLVNVLQNIISHIFTQYTLLFKHDVQNIWIELKENFAQCRYHLSGYMLRIISAYARQVFKVCSRTSVKKLMVCLLAFLSFTSSSCISSQQIKILKGIIHLK